MRKRDGGRSASGSRPGLRRGAARAWLAFALALAGAGLAAGGEEKAGISCTATAPKRGSVGQALSFTATVSTTGDLVGPDPVVGNLRYVLAGSFTQGSPADEPCREPMGSGSETQFTHVLTWNIAVMETEVTRQMWADLKVAQPTLPADPTDTSWGAGMTNPVQAATWYEAVLFANLLSAQRGLTRCYYADAEFTVPVTAANYQTDDVHCDWSADGYRLPTEGEWEYACRAGTTTTFSIAEPNYLAANCGSEFMSGVYIHLESAAWFWGNSSGINSSSPAGQKAANAWNLKDMHGNVWEWCWDWYAAAYPAGSATDYRGASGGSKRVKRGGCWSSDAQYCRSASRHGRIPSYRVFYLGFRLARSLP